MECQVDRGNLLKPKRKKLNNFPSNLIDKIISHTDIHTHRIIYRECVIY